MKSGQILLELILALAVSLIALVVIVQVTTRSITSAGFSQDQSEATTYAVAGMEWLRGQKKAMGWDGLNAKLRGSYCINNPPADFTAYPLSSCPGPISGTGFTRQLILSDVGSNQLQAQVNVSWDVGIGGNLRTFSSKQTTIFTKY